MAPPNWRDLVKEKRERQQATIPKEWIILPEKLPSPEELNVIGFPESTERCGLLTPREIEITTIVKKGKHIGGTGVEALLKKIREGEWSAVEVTLAYSKRAMVAHQLVNCLTEIFIEEALKRAQALDDHLKRTGQVVGPLHGLPVSLKDQVNLKGIESTMGYASWIGDYPERNAVLADILESLGAVFYVKTNVAQTLMWVETYNHIFGRTVNPHNRSLTSGGSSGGEGALVAMLGSPLGIGSDVGGSIRIPAGFCGVYGLRPSYSRVPYSNCRNSLEGQDSVLSVMGPIAPSISAIKLFMQSIMSKNPWLKDPLVIRKPWNEGEYHLAEHGHGRSLCFAILWDDGIVVPHPPVKRALEDVKSALIAAGHNVVDWKPIKHFEICQTILDIFNAGATEDYATVCSATGEPVIGSMGLEVETEDDTPKEVPGISAYELWQVQKTRRDLRQEYMDWWNSSEDWARTGTGRPVDAIISPLAPYAAPPHGGNTYPLYTAVWNALDYSALVIPVTNVHPVKDARVARQEFLNDLDRMNHEAYHPQVFKDAPVAIQVVGRTLEEEAVIGMGEIVDKALDVQNSSLFPRL
ncbi:general amidase [Coprinopsis marcescibilis]|uniref:amidase n=1 Tax=Coprinopsis marcescibilis TaxID=230819 RepID=A0A5C3L9N4_COPMA|nr:general amidase [Coprinopsis marcescibilis]